MVWAKKSNCFIPCICLKNWDFLPFFLLMIILWALQTFQPPRSFALLLTIPCLLQWLMWAYTNTATWHQVHINCACINTRWSFVPYPILWLFACQICLFKQLFSTRFKWHTVLTILELTIQCETGLADNHKPSQCWYWRLLWQWALEWSHICGLPSTALQVD